MTIDARIHIFAVAVAGRFEHFKMFGGDIFNGQRQIYLPCGRLCFFSVKKGRCEGQTKNINILSADKFRRQYTV